MLLIDSFSRTLIFIRTFWFSVLHCLLCILTFQLVVVERLSTEIRIWYSNYHWCWSTLRRHYTFIQCWFNVLITTIGLIIIIKNTCLFVYFYCFVFVCLFVLCLIFVFFFVWNCNSSKLKFYLTLWLYYYLKKHEINDALCTCTRRLLHYAIIMV